MLKKKPAAEKTISHILSVVLCLSLSGCASLFVRKTTAYKRDPCVYPAKTIIFVTDDEIPLPLNDLVDDLSDAAFPSSWLIAIEPVPLLLLFPAYLCAGTYNLAVELPVAVVSDTLIYPFDQRRVNRYHETMSFWKEALASNDSFRLSTDNDFQKKYTLSCLDKLLPPYLEQEVVNHNLLLQMANAGVGEKYIVSSRHVNEELCDILLSHSENIAETCYVLSSNTRLSAGVLEKVQEKVLSETDSEMIRPDTIWANLARNPSAPDSILSTLPSEVDQYVVGNKNASLNTLLQIIERPSSSYPQHFPPEWVDILCAQIVNHPSMDAKSLRLLFNKFPKNRLLRIQLAEHPDTPKDLLRTISCTDDKAVLESLGRNPFLPEDLMVVIAKAPVDEWILLDLSKRNPLPRETQVLLVTNDNARIRSALISNPSLDSDVLYDITQNEKDFWSLSMIASLTNAPEKVYMELAIKGDQEVIRRLARNKFVSDTVLSKILEKADFETARYIFKSERSSSATKTKALDVMTDQILAWSHNRSYSEIVESPFTSRETLWKLIENGWDTAKEVLRNKNVTEEMVVEMVKIRAKEPRNSQTKEFDLMISHPLIIQGIPCSERTSFDCFGKLIKTTLSEDFITNDLIFPADTTISFYASGKTKSIHLKAEVLIHGILCSKWSHVEFYESGKIYKYTPKSDIKIQEITCAGVREITFYESGKLKRAFIKEDHDVRGVPCAGGQHLDFLESGALKNRATVYYNNAKILRASGKLEEALAEVNLVLKESPFDVDGLIERGRINQSRKNIRDAQADFRKVLTLDSKNSEAHYGLAGCFWVLNDWNQVINHCTTAISLNNNSISALYLRAMAHHKNGEYEKATSDFNRLLTQFRASNHSGWPGEADVSNYLAWLLATCPKKKYRDGVQALTLAQKIVEMKRSGPHLDTLAAALAETGDFKEAVKVQKEAVCVVKKEGLLNLLDPFNQRLDSYKKGSPWRE
jgi:tetratricopeptide (TPR) repeat protein/uncharacterized protein YceK